MQLILLLKYSKSGQHPMLSIRSSIHINLSQIGNTRLLSTVSFSSSCNYESGIGYETKRRNYGFIMSFDRVRGKKVKSDSKCW